MDNIEKIAVVLSFTSIISLVIRGVDNMENKNKKNVSTVFEVYKNKIKINVTSRVLSQVLYAWIIVYLLYASVLYLLQDVNFADPVIVLVVFAIMQNFLVSDTIRNIAYPKIENEMIGYTLSEKYELEKSLNKINALLQTIPVVLLFLFFLLNSKYKIYISVIIVIVCILALLCYKVYHFLVIEDRTFLLTTKRNTYFYLELPPESSLSEVANSGYKAYFQVFLLKAKSCAENKIYNLFEYTFSIEQDGNVVIIYNLNGEVEAIHKAKDVQCINVRVGKSDIFNISETDKCVFYTTDWYKEIKNK